MTRLFPVVAFLLATLWSGCDWGNDVKHDESAHVRAYGLELVQNGTVALRYFEGETATPLAVGIGTSPVATEVYFLDEDGERIDRDHFGDEHAMQFTVANSSLVAVTALGKFTLGVQGLAAGETTLLIEVLHEGHADFRSNPLPVRVAQ